MLQGLLSYLVRLNDGADLMAGYWSRVACERREAWLVLSLGLSSLVSLAPFTRDVSISNFLIYALLPAIIVIANAEKSKATPFPSGAGFLLAISFILGSFLFNYVTGILTGDYCYGLTDYVILVIGVFSLYYSILSYMTQMGGLLLLVLRSVTLGLNAVYSSAFVTVSGFFVGIVVFFSKIFVSGDIQSGFLPGEIYVGGEAGSASVFIGWACAGLEELALISVILYVLISAFEISRRMSAMWIAVGIAGSFMVNIIRMTLLVWVAHAYGIEEMLWVHTHLGDALFLVWIAIFWFVFFRFVKQNAPQATNGGREF